MKKITIIDGEFHEEEVPDNSPYEGRIIRKRVSEIVSGGGLFEQLETGRASSPYTPLTTERLENLLRDISGDTPEPYDTSLVEEMRQYSDDYNLNQLRMENAIRQSTIVTDQMIRETITAVFDENPLPQIYTGAAGQRAFDEAMRRELQGISGSLTEASRRINAEAIADRMRQYPLTHEESVPDPRVEMDPEITRYLTERGNEINNRRTRRANRSSQRETNQP